MSETDPCIIGVQSCGCITYANARPDDLHRDDEKAIARIVREGGHVERLTVGEARAKPDFMNVECPHDPKGWEREPYIDPAEKISVRKTYRAGVYMIVKGRGHRIGEVRKAGKVWDATTGWFNRAGGADDGGDRREPVAVLGPFDKRQAAVDALAKVPARA